MADDSRYLPLRHAGRSSPPAALLLASALAVEDLELLPAAFDFDRQRFADRWLYPTHSASNRIDG